MPRVKHSRRFSMLNKARNSHPAVIGIVGLGKRNKIKKNIAQLLTNEDGEQSVIKKMTNKKLGPNGTVHVFTNSSDA